MVTETFEMQTEEPETDLKHGLLQNIKYFERAAASFFKTQEKRSWRLIMRLSYPKVSWNILFS